MVYVTQVKYIELVSGHHAQQPPTEFLCSYNNNICFGMSLFLLLRHQFERVDDVGWSFIWCDGCTAPKENHSNNTTVHIINFIYLFQWYQKGTMCQRNEPSIIVSNVVTHAVDACAEWCVCVDVNDVCLRAIHDPIRIKIVICNTISNKL